jgi:hypothetical protein
VYYKPGKTRVAVNNVETGYFNYPKAYYEGGAMPVTSISVVIPRKVLDETGGFPLGIKLGEDFLLWAKIAMQYKVAFLNELLAWYNNDVPATLRATRNLHAPEHHMLFNLGRLGDEAMRREAKGDEARGDEAMRRLGEELEDWYNQVLDDNKEKIARVKEIFEQLGVREACEQVVRDYTQRALDILETLPQNEASEELRKLAEKLLVRRV